jgi:hypothetical protein
MEGKKRQKKNNRIDSTKHTLVLELVALSSHGHGIFALNFLGE